MLIPSWNVIGRKNRGKNWEISFFHQCINKEAREKDQEILNELLISVTFFKRRNEGGIFMSYPKPKVSRTWEISRKIRLFPAQVFALFSMVYARQFFLPGKGTATLHGMKGSDTFCRLLQKKMTAQGYRRNCHCNLAEQMDGGFIP